jgi:AcrR family transcriptional regulator
MRELADTAGVTVPGLYYHFDSKTDLIREVLRARGLTSVADRPEPPEAERVRERIVAEARREFTRLLGEEVFLRFVQREATGGDPDALEVAAGLTDDWRARWREVLAGSVDLDPRVDLEVAAVCVVTFLWAIFVEYLSYDDPRIIDRIDAFAMLVAPGLTGSLS